MTTKFLDNKICTFKILLSWRFPRNQAFLDDFPLWPQRPPPSKVGGRKTAQEKNKFLGTEVPRNFSDQCSLDFAYFLCLFSGRRAKSSQELCSWELFFLILGGFSPSEKAQILFLLSSRRL